VCASEGAAAAIDNPVWDEVKASMLRETTTSSIDSYNASRDALAGLIGQVAGTASTVSSASQQMAATSEEAGRAVGEIANAVGEASAEATGAIRALGDKSQQLGGIVDAITGIAEQTNLLALNAAIEAARAGELEALVGRFTLA
jgi:methyl-accepting chemotaxis protein